MKAFRRRYIPPLLFLNGHISTIVTHFFRKLPDIPYERERVFTPDDDFFDLDVWKNGSSTGVFILHGLEGNSNVQGVKGMAHAIRNHFGYDIIAMNQRGCSGEDLNVTYGAYHSGKTDDLKLAIETLYDRYEKIFLIGFSLGGNIVLKYTGEMGKNIPPKVKKAIAISTPVDLVSSARKLARWYNRPYLKKFLNILKPKAMIKGMWFPEREADLGAIMNARSFYQFDDAYTAPAHKFKNALEYYKQAQSINVLDQCAIPTLLINARNDSFLSGKCYPDPTRFQNNTLFLLYPRFGGHVSFMRDWRLKKPTWAEEAAIAFISSDSYDLFK